jgi:hypothetical protein
MKRLPELSTLLDGHLNDRADLDRVRDSRDFGFQAAQSERPQNNRIERDYEEGAERKLHAVCNNDKKTDNALPNKSMVDPTAALKSTNSCSTANCTTDKEPVGDPDLVTSPISVKINSDAPEANKDEPNNDVTRIRIVSVESLSSHYKVRSPNHCVVTNGIQPTPPPILFSDAAERVREGTGTATEVLTTWSSTHWYPVAYSTQFAAASPSVIFQPLPGLIHSQWLYHVPPSQLASISPPVYNVATVAVSPADFSVRLVRQGQRVSGARKRKLSVKKTIPAVLYRRPGESVTLTPVVPTKKSKVD